MVTAEMKPKVSTVFWMIPNSPNFSFPRNLATIIVTIMPNPLPKMIDRLFQIVPLVKREVRLSGCSFRRVLTL